MHFQVLFPNMKVAVYVSYVSYKNFCSVYYIHIIRIGADFHVRVMVMVWHHGETAAKHETTD